MVADPALIPADCNEWYNFRPMEGKTAATKARASKQREEVKNYPDVPGRRHPYPLELVEMAAVARAYNAYRKDLSQGGSYQATYKTAIEQAFRKAGAELVPDKITLRRVETNQKGMAVAEKIPQVYVWALDKFWLTASHAQRRAHLLGSLPGASAKRLRLVQPPRMSKIGKQRPAPKLKPKRETK